MNDLPEEERIARIRSARQVLAGDAVRPSPDPWGDGRVTLSPLQRNYVIGLAVLLVVGVVLAWIVGLGIATAVFFLLALGLIAAWLIF
jgi:Flp pilus assembly protein TadB